MTRTPIAVTRSAVSAPIPAAASTAHPVGVEIFTSRDVGLHAFFLCITAPLRISFE